jgi:large subunit ribosomal protein L6
MSRIGKHPVQVPAGVTVAVEGRTIKATGKLGELAYTVSDDVAFTVEGNVITVTPLEGNKRSKTVWGSARTQVSNLVNGVATGFKRDLEINGVGYRAAIQGQDLVLSLGFSHEVRYPIPVGIQIKCEKPTAIAIFGADKQKVGQVAAEIRSYRPPEPYKGKGVKYSDETVLRKEGKKK